MRQRPLKRRGMHRAEAQTLWMRSAIGIAAGAATLTAWRPEPQYSPISRRAFKGRCWWQARKEASSKSGSDQLASANPSSRIGNNDEDDELTKIQKAFGGGQDDAPGQSSQSPQMQDDAYA